MTQVFVDMDGVLADFDRHYRETFGITPSKVLDNTNWEWVRKVPGFYASIPPTPDMMLLWSYVERLTPEPIILTGVPSGEVPEAEENKRGWVREHIGAHVKVITCKSRDKCLHGKPGDVLIDDWEKHKSKWINMGGIWITHVNAPQSIQALMDLNLGCKGIVV